nr:uncharacterized protein LOC122270275 [Parasteatoda tepidariorum]
MNNYDDKVWQLCLLLRSITEIVCAPQINKGQIVYLQSAIEEYLFTRAQLFPSVPLRPKHHYLAHYPTLIVKFGPLIRSWTLRFESKHSYFKRCARQSRNFKNICSTLANRHQLLQTYIHTDNSVFTDLDIKNYNEFHVELYSENLRKIIPSNLFDKTNTVITYDLSIKGTDYKKGSFLPISEDCEISFCEILMILIKNNNEVFFVVQNFETTFISQLGVYEISSKNKEFFLISKTDLIDYYPLQAYEIGGSRYICLHHAIESS